MTLGVFVDPSPALESLVRERKGIAATHWPEAPYLAHPVHATLLAGAYADPHAWLPELAARLAKLAPFAVECRAPFVFADDPATGGSTVVIDVAPSSALSALQLAVAEVIAPYRDQEAAEALARRFSTLAPSTSARAFGAPWVGAHWHPHFTVGSFPVAADAPELAPLLAPFSPIIVPVRAISVWAIEGESHTRRAEVALGPGAQA
jgi:hypothetical protein